MKIDPAQVATLPSINQKSTVIDQQTKVINEKTTLTNKKASIVTAEETIIEKKDQYIPASKAAETTGIYEKPKVDQATITQLKEESERVYGNLKSMVEELLKRQGMTWQDAEAGKEFTVDEKAITEAQALLSDGGELSPENVSDRIVEFAKALSGGDKTKFDTLKSGIEDGFKEAARILGGKLPEVSQKTYDLVMEKLDKWKNETGETSGTSVE